LYGALIKGVSGSVAIYWKFKRIKDYLSSITTSFGAGLGGVGATLVYNLYDYPSSKKKFVGIQISYGNVGIYQETAPIDGGIYIPLKKKLSSLFKSCGENTYLLGKKAKKLKVKVG
jgi:hypothetical protein